MAFPTNWGILRGSGDWERNKDGAGDGLKLPGNSDPVNHTRLKSFIAKFPFLLVVFHQGDSKSRYPPNK